MPTYFLSVRSSVPGRGLAFTQLFHDGGPYYRETSPLISLPPRAAWPTQLSITSRLVNEYRIIPG